MLPAAAQGEHRRIFSLDAARALGVVAMVFGHTLDALLTPAFRATPAVVVYWKGRGLTAPLFLMVSGWAVTVAIRRGRARGLAIPRGRLGRVLVLLAIGYALRWPGWGVDLLVAGQPDVWAHFLAFDALHTIAIALLVSSAILALPWNNQAKAGAFALLALLAVALGMRSPAPDPVALPASPVALALVQAVGGTSQFPLFPWIAYFFAGALVGLLAGAGGGRAAQAMGALGGALVVATCWTGVGTMPPGNPLLFAFRTGVVLAILALLSAVPAGIAARVAPLGRASLGIYAIHVAIVYGWSTYQGLAQRIGPTLSFADASLAAALLLAASFALHHVASAGWRGARWTWSRRFVLVEAAADALRGRTRGLQ